ncbi:MAG TPA: alpha/beta family hydrolase [Desulfatiglandales bacterium]|nr:alpha/beta family hydrolase [Desulfatiglandales bacterium]
MYEVKRLKIAGYHSEPVDNTFFLQEHPTDHLSIIFPGMGYTSHMPLLYYPARLLLILGDDVLRLEYDYNKRPEFLKLPLPERAEWMLRDVSAACKAVSSQRSYQRITLIGKSIGTLAMGHLLTTDAMFEKAQTVWLTPLLRNESLRTQIKQCGQHSLFVIGTADPHYDPDYLAEAKAATNGESLVVEGADHSLEIEGDLLQSLKAMERVVLAIEKFLMG